jgi:type I restriction enzyme S subunit
MKKYRLKDIATVEISSVDKKTKESETNVRLCNFTDVYYNWAITKDKHDNFMEATANNKEISRFLFKKGQVALTKDSETRYDIGLATYIADDFEDVVLGYHCALITPDESKVVGCYLNAFLHSNMSRKYFANSASGSGQRYTLSIQTIEEMPILLPEIEEQKQIGKLFSNIDRKIEINRSLNHNLEAMAKQLYDYWFVQFDFPDENGKPYKSSGGKMKYCEELQIEMPDGWNVCRLSEFVSKNNTGDWGTDNPSENSIEIGCIRGADIIKLNNLPKRYIKSSNRAKLLSVWDVVIEVSGGSPIQATGRSAFITSGVIERNGGKITCSNFCHAFSFKDYKESAYFFYIWKMFYDNGIMFNYEGKTSGIKNFMTETFLANKWVKAPKGLIYKFFDTIKSIYAKIDANITESNALIKQRDELLLLLMNGQATVNYDLSND